MSTRSKKTGVVLMTYGSATVAEHVRDYMHAIYGDKASDELIEDFEKRYAMVGSSPLIEITLRQAAALEKQLGANFFVRAGMQHSAPTILEAVGKLKAAGAERVVGIILSPQFSSFIMEGYKERFAQAAREHGFAEQDARVAQPWPDETRFVELLAKRVEEGLARVRALHSGKVPVVFTTHSLPERVVAKDPSYLDQLKATIDAIRTRLNSSLECYAGYQSAGHTPETWLKPDLTDILEEVRGKGARAVLIVPIQFLADHLEILYDLDIAGAQQCAERGISYHRIELPNDDPLFIQALADVALKTL